MSHSFIYQNEEFIPVNKELIGIHQFKDIHFYVRNVILHDSRVNPPPIPEEYTVFLKKRDYPSFMKQLFLFNKSKSGGANLQDLNLNIEALYNSFQNFGVSPENLFLVKDVSIQIVQMNTHSGLKELISLLVQGKKIHKSLFNSFFTKLMMANMKWEFSNNVEKVILASFFSTIPEICNQIPDSCKNILSDDILKIIAHSHENQDGSGPLKVKKFYIHPLSKPIRVASEFYPFFVKKDILQGVNHLKSLTPSILDTACVNSVLSIFKK